MDKRKVLLWAGKQITNMTFGGVMSIVLGILAFLFAYINKDALEKTFDYQSSNELIISVVIGVVSIFIAFLCIQLLGHGLIYWGKSLRPNIKILSFDIAQVQSDFDNQRQLQLKHTFASLKIINNEDFELRKSYAVFKRGHPNTLSKDSLRGHWVQDIGKKISWKNTQECYVNIGAWNGEETLQVFKITISIDKSQKLSVDSANFCFCNDNQRMLSPLGIYEFEIDIHGELDGESIKPIPYIGTFDASIVAKTEHSITIPDLKITEILDKKNEKKANKQPDKEKKEVSLKRTSSKP